MKKPCSDCKNSYTYRRLKTFVSVPNKVQCAECSKYKNYLEWRKSKQKYTQGAPICSMSDFDKHIADGFMYWNHKIQHASWLTNMQYRTIEQAVKQGVIYIAIKK